MADHDPTHLEFWRQLDSLRRRLAEDDDLRRRFEADPTDVLRERDLDLTFTAEETGSEPTTFVTLFEDLEDSSRHAVADALLRLSAIPERNRVQVVFPIVNVVVVANALALANAAAAANAAANANVKANVNVRGIAGGDLPRPRALAVQIESEAQTEDFDARMDELKVSAERRQTLLRRTLTEPEYVVRREPDEEGRERVVARRAYRGVVFETEGIRDADKLRIISVRVLDV